MSLVASSSCGPGATAGRGRSRAVCPRVCVIDGLLPHSPADYVRRPPVPAESPTLGLGHLQFEALITTARMPRMHPYMLRHTFVTTMLDAGVSLRDVQVAARHADPRTTHALRPRPLDLDRHANYILAAFMASGTCPTARTDSRPCRCPCI
jgi:hypothetical protein